MNVEKFVQNVKKLCEAKGTTPTAACKECGVGTSFIPDIKRGRVPSIDKFEKLAYYLGVTVSELIGDTRSTLITFQHILPPEDTIDKVFESFNEQLPFFIQNFKRFFDDMDPPISNSFSGPYTIFLDARLQNYDATDVSASGYGIISSVGNTLSSSEQELLTRFRDLPSEAQEAFLEILRAVATGQNKS